MNLVLASGRLFRSLPKLVKTIPSVRGAIYLDRDWMPGDYPKTEEERLAAAKKYNLLPEEYEPYDPVRWEMVPGDYPKLPNLHRADLDSDNAWDYQLNHHNYGDPWHYYHQRYVWYAPEINEGYDYFPKHQMFVVYFFAISAMVLYTWFFNTYDRVLILKPKHIMFPGDVHYHYPNSKIEKYEEHHHHHH